MVYKTTWQNLWTQARYVAMCETVDLLIISVNQFWWLMIITWTEFVCGLRQYTNVMQAIVFNIIFWRVRSISFAKNCSCITQICTRKSQRTSSNKCPVAHFHVTSLPPCWRATDNTFSLLWEKRSIFMQNCFIVSALQHGRRLNPLLQPSRLIC